MQQGLPPLFNQGVSARARLAFFAFLAVALIVIDARVKALETVRVGAGVVLYPIQSALRWPLDAAGGLIDHVARLRTLVADNERLAALAARQAQQLADAEQLRAENARLRQLLELRERQGASGLAVQVLYEPRDPFSRKLVLDKGSLAGVAAGQPVVDETGVVGQITRVFPSTAEVTLLTDRDQAIPVQVLRNGMRGVAFGGDTPGTLDLRFMAANVELQQDDLLVTSGLDGLYPPGLPVGRVLRIERGERDQFARVVLAPAAGLDARAHLMVLKVDPLPAAPPPAVRTEPRKGGSRSPGKSAAKEAKDVKAAPREAPAGTTEAPR